MRFTTILFSFITVVTTYWFIIRPLLKRQAALAGVFAQLDATEAGLWVKVKVWVAGIKTIMAARLIWVPGVLVWVYDTFVSSIDWSKVIPEDKLWVVPLAAAALTGFFEWMRRISHGAVPTDQ
jgi:hypothetical protein